MDHPRARSPELEGLAQKRLADAARAVEYQHALYVGGRDNGAAMLAAYRGVAFAARDSSVRGELLNAALNHYRQHAQDYVEMLRGRLADGKVNPGDVIEAEKALSEAEYWSAEARLP